MYKFLSDQVTMFFVIVKNDKTCDVPRAMIFKKTCYSLQRKAPDSSKLLQSY